MSSTVGVFAKGTDTANRIMQWVRDGNAAAMLADQREGRGMRVTMFGMATLANPFPAIVARRLRRSARSPAVSMRLPGGRFRMEAVEIPVPVTDDVQADVTCGDAGDPGLLRGLDPRSPGRMDVGAGSLEHRRARGACVRAASADALPTR